MRLLSFFSFFSYMTFIGLLVWRGSESPVWTALGLVGFAVSITLFWWTVMHDQAASARCGLYGCGS